jgi:hypothetical protein
VEKEIKKFWEKWLRADSNERLKMVEELPIMDLMKVKDPSLLNSYFEDLADTVMLLKIKKVKV